MNKILIFSKRNLKELLRDPLIYIFCIGFPFIMLVLFQVINKYTGGKTPMFELRSLLPAMLAFSYTFVMLITALNISKDRQTSFLKRLYTSPMKSHDFIFGYALVSVLIGIAQTIICVLSGFIISLITQADFPSFGEILLLSVSQFPILLANVFLGILFGTIFNDKSAPGVCSIFINFAGILGGCWMPLESMGNFETFCRFLPYYPSVYLGRVITHATNNLGLVYTFDATAALGIIPIALFTAVSIALSFIVFKKNMTNDK
ncbi:MAG: hypothetical protein E7352_01365 [Clostridiales bacterium]|nr:hypothetical protein [Clostridiales bacterium]MBE5746810.1 hypothetical protein [Clostridiales bacterium]